MELSTPSSSSLAQDLQGLHWRVFLVHMVSYGSPKRQIQVYTYT